MWSDEHSCLHVRYIAQSGKDCSISPNPIHVLVQTGSGKQSVRVRIPGLARSRGCSSKYSSSTTWPSAAVKSFFFCTAGGHKCRSHHGHQGISSTGPVRSDCVSSLRSSAIEMMAHSSPCTPLTWTAILRPGPHVICRTGMEGRLTVNAPGGCSGVPFEGSGTLFAVLSGSTAMPGKVTASSKRASEGSLASPRLASPSSTRTGSCFSQNTGSLSLAPANFAFSACSSPSLPQGTVLIAGRCMSARPGSQTERVARTSAGSAGYSGIAPPGTAHARIAFVQ